MASKENFQSRSCIEKISSHLTRLSFLPSLQNSLSQEASRLIFVSVKGAVPRRYEEAVFPFRFFIFISFHCSFKKNATKKLTLEKKTQTTRRTVAVPVPDGYTWEAFLDQVCQRLKLSGVAALYLSSTGERVTSLECLQDIDELVAVDADGSSSGGANAAAAAAAARARSGGVAGPSSHHHHHRSSEIGPADSGGNGYNSINGASAMGVGYFDDDEEEGGDRKYQPRRGVFDRLLGRFFPGSSSSSSSSGLPLTRQEADSAGGGGNRGRRGGAARRGGGGAKELAKRSRRQRVCRMFSVLVVLAVAAFFFANFMYGPGGAARLANEVAHEVEGRVGGVMSGKK